QLSGEGAAAASEVGLPLALLRFEVRPARGAGLPLLPQIIERGLSLADRFLRSPKLAGEAVPFRLAMAHLPGDPGNLVSYRRELRPGLPGVGMRCLAHGVPAGGAGRCGCNRI